MREMAGSLSCLRSLCYTPVNRAKKEEDNFLDII